jgi:hypothetical protein
MLLFMASNGLVTSIFSRHRLDPLPLQTSCASIHSAVECRKENKVKNMTAIVSGFIGGFAMVAVIAFLCWTYLGKTKVGTTKKKARYLLELDHPDPDEIQSIISILSTKKDEESRELKRRLMAKTIDKKDMSPGRHRL